MLSLKRYRVVLLWGALAFTLSPILFDLGQHLMTKHWALYCLVFPFLILHLVVTVGTPETPQRRWVSMLGFSLLGIAAVLTLLSTAEGTLRNGRPAIPISILGLAGVLAFPPLRVAALSFWAIPVPTVLLRVASPWLERALDSSTRVVLDVFGLVLPSPMSRFPVPAYANGIVLAVLLSGLGWYISLRRDLGIWGGLRMASLGALLAFPLQWVALLLARLLEAYGQSAAADIWLQSGLWIVTTLTVLVWTSLHRKVGCDEG